jgi:hypothetical protein
MSENWIEQEAERLRLRDEKETQSASQKEILVSHTNDSWHRLKPSLLEDIKLFNSNETIQEKYRRKIQLQDMGWDGISISSDTYPAIYLSVKLSDLLVEIKWRVVKPNVEKWTRNPEINMRLSTTKKYSENLTVRSGPDNIPILDGPTGRMTFDELPQHILKQFLLEPTYFPGR